MRALRMLSVLGMMGGLCVACDMSTVVGKEGKKLTIVKPVDQTIQRGKTNDVRVTILRDDFSGPVAIEFSQLPAGVQVTEARKEIPASDNSATFTLHAHPAAALVSSHRVLVTAKAADAEVSQNFQLTVKE